MRAKNVARALQKKHDDFLSHIENKIIRQILNEHTFITGGAIPSLLLNEEPGDFDYYFDNVESCYVVTKYFIAEFRKDNPTLGVDIVIERNDDDGSVQLYIPSDGMLRSEHLDKKRKYQTKLLSTNAISIANRIQLVVRFIGPPLKVHKNFDFIHTKCIWKPGMKTIGVPNDTAMSILTKELQYVGSRYPLCSIIRTRKFIKKGWIVTAGDYLKMALQLNRYNLTEVSVLIDQLTGVDVAYFREVIDKITEASKKGTPITESYLFEVIDEVFR